MRGGSGSWSERLLKGVLAALALVVAAAVAVAVAVAVYALAYYLIVPDVVVRVPVFLDRPERG
jgi:hypothetical protein